MDYIPGGDSELLEFADNFITKTDGNEADYGLTAADTTEVKALRLTFAGSYADNNSKQTTAKSARKQKDADRKPLVSKLRESSQVVQEHPKTTDAMREGLNLPIQDKESSNIGEPATVPVAEIDTSVKLRHEISFYNEGSESKGKPDGVEGCQIWCKIGGDATMNEDDYRYLATDTGSPYLVVHKAENIGKQAHYLLRWVNAKGEPGPWSAPLIFNPNKYAITPLLLSFSFFNVRDICDKYALLRPINVKKP